MSLYSDELTPSAQDPRDAVLALRAEIAKVVVGQEGTLSGLVAALLVRGHVLLEGVPGVAKTLLVKTMAHALDLDFKRVQFTPDLMPSDVTGQLVLDVDGGGRGFTFREGPIFTNLFLADEINRTPPKTQAALLEAMEERQVTAEGLARELPDPFIVIATENPVEQEGTYPLPEAQLDRFMFNILVGYPTAEEEEQIIRQVTGTAKPVVSKLLDARTVQELQQVVRRVPVADHVINYAATLVRASRPKEKEAPDFVKEMVGWGALPTKCRCPNMKRSRPITNA